MRSVKDQQAWLDQVSETATDPDIEICDPHHHLWDFPQYRYMLDELLADTNSGHRVESTVFLECGAMYAADESEPMRPVGETEFVQGIAAQSASGQYGTMRACAGIVGHANLQLGEKVRPVLEAHQRASVNRFRGIRHSCGWNAVDEYRQIIDERPPSVFLDETFRQGFACLEALGMSFDAWCWFHHIVDLADLARAFPNITIVLDHLGGPVCVGPQYARREAVIAEWRDAIAELARCPNVYAKLGGLNMRMCGFDWHHRDKPPSSSELADATAPFYQHCIDQFGSDRCMFESNFPVDKVSCSYVVLWNSFKRIAARLSPDDQAALFRDTARRVYRIEPSA